MWCYVRHVAALSYAFTALGCVFILAGVASAVWEWKWKRRSHGLKFLLSVTAAVQTSVWLLGLLFGRAPGHSRLELPGAVLTGPSSA